MTTEKQTQANRSNALNSTGPRTAEGKERAKKNALSHGLTAKEALLPGESAEEFCELLACLRRHFRPDGELEHQEVERIAMCMWRRRRAYRYEIGIIEMNASQHRAAAAESAMQRKLSRYVRDDGRETVLLRDNNECRAAWEEFEASSAAAAAQAGTDAGGFLFDARGTNGISKLLRYEASNDSALERAMNRIRTLQKERHSHRGTASEN